MAPICRFRCSNRKIDPFHLRGILHTRRSETILLVHLAPAVPPANLARMNRCLSFLGLLLCLPLMAEPLPGTKLLTMKGDLSAQMVEGISRFLDRETAASIQSRKQFWKRDFSSRAAYAWSIQPNRDRLKKFIGVVDERLPVPALEYVATTSSSGIAGESEHFRVYAVRWPVINGVYAEGLLVQPKQTIRARVVAIPDAGQTPEQLMGLAPGIPLKNQYARWLAQVGVQVVIPTLIDRTDEFSGSERLQRWTNQPHREWIYRQAFEMGRHVIGYEVQSILAAIDWFEHQHGPVGVIGYNEGGLLALYTAAIDTRIDSASVSGYFQSRQQLWSEPIYHNVFSLLHEFGDAEFATLVSPCQLILEYSSVPEIVGPPETRKGRRKTAAPGVWKTPSFKNVNDEWIRAITLMASAPNDFPKPILVSNQQNKPAGPGSPAALIAFLSALGIDENPFALHPSKLTDIRKAVDPLQRQQRQVRQLEAHVQNLLLHAADRRNDRFWKKLKPSTGENWFKNTEPFYEEFKHEVVGWFDNKRLPLNPRSRQFKETDKWIGHEVVLDVWQDVYAWGYLLVPKGIKLGERRPVVVCQHGLEGLPDDVINEDQQSRAWRAYKAFAVKLVERGFVVFAPHNPYRGKDSFRELQRKLNPLKKTLFSVIVPQHSAIIDWLESQPFVDPDRIGFYGLSYGGKSAMRIPALETRYALSICSADFNEWVWKNASVNWRSTYMFTGEYEIYEWDLGHTYNYAEMAALICPRPFMVERGHKDGVGIDEWVAFEYARVRRMYDYLGLGDLTEIEWFNGPHTINEQGTYRFLHKHLNWPEPK